MVASGDQAGWPSSLVPGTTLAVPVRWSTIVIPSQPRTAISPLRGGAELPAVALEPTARSGSVASNTSQAFTLVLFHTSGARDGLLTCKAGIALLDEGGHAFLRIRAGEELAEGVGFGLEVLDVVALEGVVDRGLGGRDRERALGRDRARDLERLLQ